MYATKKEVRKKGNLPENVAEAMTEYLMARLEANGNVPIPLKQVMFEFAKWHGADNLRKGVLRPESPPIPERTLLDAIEPGEC